MKKTFVLLLVLTLAFTICGCGNSAGTAKQVSAAVPSSSNDTNSAAATPDQTIYLNIGDETELSDFISIKFTKYEFQSDKDYYKAYVAQYGEDAAKAAGMDSFANSDKWAINLYADVKNLKTEAIDDAALGRHAFGDDASGYTALLTLNYQDAYDYPLTATSSRIDPLETQSVVFLSEIPAEVGGAPGDCGIRFSYSGKQYCLILS